MRSNNDQFEEIVAYNDLMTYIEKDYDNKILRHFKKSPHMKAR